MLEGPRLLTDAFDRSFPIDAVFAGPGARRAFAGLIDRALAAGVPVHDLKEGVLEKIGSTRTPQPVLALAPLPPAPAVGDLPPGLLVVTAGLQDPGNLGTVVRSAEAAGAAGVIAAGGVDPWNPKVVRGSAGAVLGLPMLVPDDLRAALDALRARGASVVAADVAAPTAYTDADLTGFVALVVGSEAHGVPADLATVVDEYVAIPMSGPTDSLNAAVAASVLMFEAARQRGS